MRTTCRSLGSLLVWFSLVAGVFCSTPRANAQQPASKATTTALSTACLARLKQCQDACVKQLSQQAQGFLPSTPTNEALPICRRQCRKKHLPSNTCRPSTSPAPPPPTRMPSPREIAGLTPFCRQFLSICTRSCIRSNSQLVDKQGHTYPLKVLQLFCNQRCWNLPARKRLCKMKHSQLLDQSDELMRQSEQEFKQAVAEEKQEEQRYLRQQAEINKEREAEAAKRQKQALEEMKAKQWQRMEARRLKEERLALAKERARMLALQKRLKSQRRNLADPKLQELSEEQKRLKLQRKQLLEEQRRLKILQQQVKEQQKEKRQQQELEATRKREQDKLLQEQRAELKALRKQRLEYNQKLSKMRSLALKEKQMAKEAAQLKRQRRLAKARERRKLEQREKLLRRKSKQLGKDKQAFQQSRKSFKNSRTKRRRRLAMLRKQVRTSGKRKLRRTIKQKAQQAFRNSQWDQSKQLYAKAKRPDLVEKLTEYQSVLANGKQAYELRNTDAAIPDLERAYTLDLELGGKDSKHATSLRQMLADMYHLKGRLSMSRKYYASGLIYFSAARRYIFAHQGATEGISTLRKMSLAFFERAKTYPAKSRYRRKLLRKAVRLVSKTDPLYKQIQSILDKS